MGEVVKLKRPRNGTIRGAAREMLTDAMKSVAKPIAVVIVTLGEDGRYALRQAGYTEKIHDFDAYSRASSAIDKARAELLD